ncbi:surface lipoprotein assembly modifier [Acinetobacter gerneri]|uniref:surface lipoprotein assembly modifier n=1 Tax=Acinetobacter gerneri TaxID=202952 RepID=UPI003AF53B47
MKKISLICLVMSSSILHAADDDTRFRLDQELLQQKKQQQQPLLQQQKQDQLPTMVIDGEKIEVKKNSNELGRALYIAVMQKQWQAASIYLEHYLKLNDHDPSLVYFAQGALQRVQGNLSQAEHDFKQALDLQPQNAMIKLELARLYTERQKNNEAKQLFEQVKHQLGDTVDPTLLNIHHAIDIYLDGLKKRDAWQGSINLGTRYATNINSATEKTTTWTTFGKDQNGNIIPIQIKRGTPDPIDATAFDYEGTLSKRWSLQEDHGLALKAFAYGRVFDGHKDFNEMTLNLNAGYSFQNQRNQILVAPVYEHRRYSNETFSNAWGGHLEWMHFLGHDKAFKLETEIKDINNTKYSTQSGLESSVYSTFWKILPQQWTVFTGLDFTDHRSKEKIFNQYQQQGIRFGFSKQWNTGFNATAFSSFRWRQYATQNQVLGGERRHDFEQNYTVVLSAPRWQFYGVIPNLTYQYNNNLSNIDWLYSYDKHNVSLRLEYRF